METASGSCCMIIPFQTNRNRVRSIERLPTYAACSIGEAKWRCKCSNQRQQWLRSSCSGCFFSLCHRQPFSMQAIAGLEIVVASWLLRVRWICTNIQPGSSVPRWIHTNLLSRSSGFVRKLPILPKACWPHVSTSSLKVLACILRRRLFFEQTT